MVLLGFIDEPRGGKIGDDDDPSNWTISRIGGQAAFPNENIATQLKSSLSCAKCQNEQIFVCQIYSPLEGHKYDRTIYLFACRNPSCWNSSESWTAVRCLKFDETVEEVNRVDDEPSATAQTSSTDWCDDADEWNSDDDQIIDNNKKVTTNRTKVNKEPEVMLNTMKINDDEHENAKSSSDEDDDDNIESETKKKSANQTRNIASSDAFHEWKKHNLNHPMVDLSNNKQFPFYYIVIDDEDVINNEAKLAEQKKMKNKMKTLNSIDEDGDDDDDDDTKNSAGQEKYEKTPDIEHGDVVFYRFQQKIRYAPDQIIRYDWSGNPLILRKINSNSLSTVQTCRYCHSKSIFEFQLMPALVNYLKIDNQTSLEFGTVFVYTCLNSCWNDENDLYRLENVFVQADPDQSLFD